MKAEFQYYKVAVTTAEDNILKFILILFGENKAWHFMWIIDDSNEISSLIFPKK